MEKKKYTKPGVVKVELNHEQAVLGTCAVGGTSIRTGGAAYCDDNTLCRQYRSGLSASTS